MKNSHDELLAEGIEVVGEAVTYKEKEVHISNPDLFISSETKHIKRQNININKGILLIGIIVLVVVVTAGTALFNYAQTGVTLKPMNKTTSQSQPTYMKEMDLYNSSGEKAAILKLKAIKHNIPLENRNIYAKDTEQKVLMSMYVFDIQNISDGAVSQVGLNGLTDNKGVATTIISDYLKEYTVFKEYSCALPFNFSLAVGETRTLCYFYPTPIESLLLREPITKPGALQLYRAQPIDIKVGGIKGIEKQKGESIEEFNYSKELTKTIAVNQYEMLTDIAEKKEFLAVPVEFKVEIDSDNFYQNIKEVALEIEEGVFVFESYPVIFTDGYMSNKKYYAEIEHVKKGDIIRTYYPFEVRKAIRFYLVYEKTIDYGHMNTTYYYNF